MNCFDPSSALQVAQNDLAQQSNVVFHKGTLDASGLALGSQDFGGSLSTLRHVPHTVAAIRSCQALLKPQAPLPLYLYYALDNRPVWYRALRRNQSGGVV